jgi:hypothetical protein
LLALALCAALLGYHAWWDSDGVNDLRKAILVQGAGYFGADEYEVRGADHYDLDLKLPRVSVLPAKGAAPKAELHIERWQSEHKRFTVTSEKPVTVVLRLMTYPAWKLSINGQPASWQARTNTEEMLIAVPSGNSQIDVRFTRTADRTLGSAISLAAAALWLLLMFLDRRRTAA